MVTKEERPSDELLKERAERLLGKRMLLVEGSRLPADDVNRLKKLIHGLDLRSKADIRLLIDSTGGSVEPAIEFYHFVRREIESKVIGAVSGRCASAGVIILQACDERLATRHSWFLVHSPSFEPHVLSERQELRYAERLDEKFQLLKSLLREMNVETEHILAERSGRSLQVVRSWMKAGNTGLEYFRAQEAKRRGLIDRVL